MEFDLDGWRVDAVGVSLGNFIYFENLSPDLPVDVGVSINMWMEDQSLATVARWFQSLEMVESATEPERAVVGGSDALQFDLLLGPTGDPNPSTACFGYILFDETTITGETWRQGPLACTWTRFWIVDVDGLAVSVYGQVAWADDGDTSILTTSGRSMTSNRPSTTSSTVSPSARLRLRVTIELQTLV